MEEKQLAVMADERVVPGIFTLENGLGTKMRVAEIGAAVMSLTMLDASGRDVDLVLGYDRVDDYATDEYYIGTVVGRYANRIGGGKVKIGGAYYQLSTSGRDYHHHGGEEGFNKRLFSGERFEEEGRTGVRLRYTSEDGEEGYPGRLELAVTYTLTDANEWIVEYRAVSDRNTILNLTQHTYFNLSGDPTAGIDDHEFMIPADCYLPVDSRQLPTGELSPVANTAFDFRFARRLNMASWYGDQQLILGNGYDHSFVLEALHTADVKHAATVLHPASGRRLEVMTTEPSVHLYAGNYLEDVVGKNGIMYGPRAGFCLETQHFPDAPNHRHFPSTLLEAGKEYYSRTEFRIKG